jgi:sugar/nucleoside kinase (ribokinase family)
MRRGAPRDAARRTAAGEGPGPVVVVGSHVLDVLAWPVPAIPEGQGSLTLADLRVTAAGSAAGTAVDLARLGARVRSIGAVGTDTAGDLVLGLMAANGVDVSLVLRSSDAPTSATVLPIRPDGSRPALHRPGADRLFAPEHLTPARRAAIEDAAAVHLGGLDALVSLPPSELRDAVGRAAMRGALVTLDLLRPGRPEELSRLAPLLELVDWAFPNEAQLLALTAARDVAEGAARMLAAGVGAVAVTRGEEGCILVDEDGATTLPAIEVPVVDTTGCGDAYAAGFLLGLLLGASALDAAWLGTACGALVATGLGSDAGVSGLDPALSLLATAEPGAATRLEARAHAALALPMSAGETG